MSDPQIKINNEWMPLSDASAAMLVVGQKYEISFSIPHDSAAGKRIADGARRWNKHDMCANARCP